MPNVHPLPDTLAELQATWGDLGPQVIVSHSGLTVPASSLTMPSVAANGYVLSPGPPARLVYVSQPAVSVTLAATNGPWWLALHADLHTPVAGWTRRAGSHVLVQQAATQPANPSGGLVFCQVTVASLVISAVSPLLPVTSAPMSQQVSSAVAITGGSATFTETITVNKGIYAPQNAADNTYALYSDQAAGGTGRYNLLLMGTAPNYLNGTIGLRVPPLPSVALYLACGAGIYGLVTIASGSTDTVACEFRNTSGVAVGSIYTSPTGTAFNTTSDVRLKHAIAMLTGAMERVRALRPVSFRWNADDSSGVGFLAHELQQVVPEAVTGLPDEVNDDGSIKPQGVDHSRLVPWLTAGLQAALAQIDALTARISTLEEALGL